MVAVDEFVCRPVVDLVFHWYHRQKPGYRAIRPCPPFGIV